MLQQSNLIAFLATQDIDQSLAFYQDVLGLKLVSEESEVLILDANGVMLRISFVEGYKAAQHTVLGWEVANIHSAVKELSSKGVAFVGYPGFKQDEEGIWQAPDGTLLAWFRDPSGNVLSLTEFE